MASAKLNQPAGQIVKAVYHPQPFRFRAKAAKFSPLKYENPNEMKPARVVKSIDKEIQNNLENK